MRLKDKMLGRFRNGETFQYTQNDFSVSTKRKRI
jgi:hypothetical protein